MLMNLSHLLASRPAFLRQALLANTAFAYATLRDLARRIETARLHGPVRLHGVDPAAERLVPQLIALAGSQAVLEEHFDEADLVRLADALAFIEPGPEAATEFEFRLEELLARFSPPLREVLREAGVELGEGLRAPDARA